MGVIELTNETNYTMALGRAVAESDVSLAGQQASVQALRSRST